MTEKTLDIYKFSPQVKEFFDCMRKNFLSPAYEDIRLVPDYSDLHPRDISLQTQLTSEIELNVQSYVDPNGLRCILKILGGHHAQRDSVI